MKNQGSFNLRSIKDRDSKILKTYDKYQEMWQHHIDHVETVRNKMNNSAFCKTYKVNQQQAAKGDITIMDRVEQEGDNVKNSELMTTIFKPKINHGVDW
jgi:hypothetical protein